MACEAPLFSWRGSSLAFAVAAVSPVPECLGPYSSPDIERGESANEPDPPLKKLRLGLRALGEVSGERQGWPRSISIGIWCPSFEPRAESGRSRPGTPQQAWNTRASVNKPLARCVRRGYSTPKLYAVRASYHTAARRQQGQQRPRHGHKRAGRDGHLVARCCRVPSCFCPMCHSGRSKWWWRAFTVCHPRCMHSNMRFSQLWAVSFLLAPISPSFDSEPFDWVFTKSEEVCHIIRLPTHTLVQPV